MSRPTALVTGASDRVGRAIAIELARSGFDLVLHHRNSQQKLSETAEACAQLGAGVHQVRADLAEPDQVEALADATQAAFGALSLLVNNASLFSPDPFEAITAESWARMLQVNLTAPFRLSQALLPALRAADPAWVGGPEGQGALVVHLCDIGSERPLVGYTPYSVSKAGLSMLMRSMAIELAPEVRCVTLSPGQVAWPPTYSQEKRAKLAQRIPMGRCGTPEDVARLVRFLTLEGHYLNGIDIPVDGGLAARY